MDIEKFCLNLFGVLGTATLCSVLILMMLIIYKVAIPLTMGACH